MRLPIRRRGGPSERLTLHPHSPYWGEHRARYQFAADYARHAPVLDIACGTGFGAAMLADAGAERVTGVDLDRDAVLQAQARFGREGIHFLAADGNRLPLADASFRLVTSFETLEHVPAGDRFVSELRRVLAPGGVLALSTPNRAYTEMNGNTCANPFHLHEYELAELVELLGSQFSSVAVYGQRLPPRYRISPFLSDQVRMKMAPSRRLRLLWWRAQNKLPFVVKDRLSRLVSAHGFYPDERDYQFLSEGIESAPVLMAVCR